MREGGFYVPGCGIKLSCLNNPKDPKSPTNNTGLSDWVLTPVVGMGWVMLEDSLDKYLVAKVAENHAVIGGNRLRTALRPSPAVLPTYSWANCRGSGRSRKSFSWHHAAARKPRPATKSGKRTAKSVGVQFTSVTLPECAATASVAAATIPGSVSTTAIGFCEISLR